MSPFDAGHERQSVYLHPGQMHASDQPVAISTVLGSCVAVCLYDRATGVGGANHYLLPDDGAGEQTSPRYGRAAIHSLLERVLRLGGVHSGLEAKIFGGASMLKGTTSQLGMNNVKLAREIMREYSIPVVAEDVGGSRGRKLVFDLADGAAWVKVL